MYLIYFGGMRRFKSLFICCSYFFLGRMPPPRPAGDGRLFMMSWKIQIFRWTKNRNDSSPSISCCLQQGWIEHGVQSISNMLVTINTMFRFVARFRVFRVYWCALAKKAIEFDYIDTINGSLTPTSECLLHSSTISLILFFLYSVCDKISNVIAILKFGKYVKNIHNRYKHTDPHPHVGAVSCYIFLPRFKCWQLKPPENIVLTYVGEITRVSQWIYV